MYEHDLVQRGDLIGVRRAPDFGVMKFAKAVGATSSETPRHGRQRQCHSPQPGSGAAGLGVGNCLAHGAAFYSGGGALGRRLVGSGKSRRWSLEPILARLAIVPGYPSGRLDRGRSGTRGAALRRRLHPAVVFSTAAAAPVALCTAVPRSRARDVALCRMNMWGYLAAYKMPHDQPERLAGRVHVDYPIAVDRVLGLGVTPTERLQRRFARPGYVNRFERLLVFSHWIWFTVPHVSVAYVLWRDPDGFPGAGGAHVRRVRHRRGVLLVDPHRAAVVCRARGASGRRPHDGGAPDDARVRGAVLGRPLG